MKHFVCELKLHWVGYYGNLLEWIPKIYVFISRNPSIKFKWMCLELSLWCGVLDKVGKGFYLTPSITLNVLNKKYKEKYDFQFSWFNINYRKFIGKRIKYEISLEEKLKEESKIPFSSNEILFLEDYYQFLAEQDEKEDEFWKEIYKDLEADSIISSEKENFWF